jgi:hypothetical protein
VVKYWPEKGRSGHLVWRYLLRRDDPNPAPWEPGAKKFACIAPEVENSEEAPAKKIKLEKFVLGSIFAKLHFGRKLFGIVFHPQNFRQISIQKQQYFLLFLWTIILKRNFKVI